MQQFINKYSFFSSHTDQRDKLNADDDDTSPDEKWDQFWRSIGVTNATPTARNER